MTANFDSNDRLDYQRAPANPKTANPDSQGRSSISLSKYSYSRLFIPHFISLVR